MYITENVEPAATDDPVAVAPEPTLEPPLAGEECPFCPGGLLAVPEFSMPVGDGTNTTCQVAQYYAVKMNVVSAKCAHATIAQLCCCTEPPPAGEEYTFCPKGLAVALRLLPVNLI